MIRNSPVAELFADVREHVLYLQELGVDNLNVDLPEFTKAEARDVKAESALPRPVPVADVVRKFVEPPTVVPEIPKKPAPVSKPRPGSRMKALPSLAERPNPVVLKSVAATDPPAA